MSTIARRRSRPSRPSWISTSPPSCQASAPIRWWRKIGPIPATKGASTNRSIRRWRFMAGAWVRACPIRLILIRTKDRPQGLWGTFEHVDNVPPAGEGEAREPDAKDAGAPYSYFDVAKPKLGLWPTFGLPDTLPVSMDHPPKLEPTPMQVIRRHPIHGQTMALNRAYWALPGIKGTVWENYMLVASQWPTIPEPTGPQKDGGNFPDAPPTGEPPG